MQDKYYADLRDLVKWSVLLLLARRHRLDRILQVAYYRHSDFGKIEIDGQQQQMPPEILPFFRNTRNIIGLSRHPSISILTDVFEDRHSYFKAATNFVTKFKTERCVVFLDPDVGLEPEGGPDLRHVSNAETREIWEVLPSKWLYALYQHRTNYSGRPWIEGKKRQFEAAVGISQVGIGKAEEIANDVVLFYALKP
jgi:hypothetical protein